MAIGDGTSWGKESLFRINGLILNDRVTDPNNYYHLDTIEGLQSDPDLAGEAQKNPGGHGDIPPGNPLYGGRTIVMRGFTIASSMMNLRRMQRALKKAFPLGISTLYIEPYTDYLFQNKLTNPNAYLDTAGWVNGAGAGLGAGGTLTRVTGVAPPVGTTAFNLATTGSGAGSQGVGFIMPVAAGKTYTFFGAVKRLSGTGTLTFDVSIPGVASQGTALAAGTPAAWTTYEVTFTATHTGNALVRIYSPNSNTAAGVFQFANMGWKPGGTVGGYRDGDSAGWNWHGEPQASASSAMVPVQMDVRKSAPMIQDERQDSMKRQREFMITLRADNPRILSQTLRTAAITPANGATSGQTTINAIGDFPAQVTVRFTGPHTANPNVYNSNPNITLKLLKSSVSAGQYVEFQHSGHRKRPVDHTGAVKPSYFDSGGKYMIAPPGPNVMTLQMGTGRISPADASFTFRDTWI